VPELRFTKPALPGSSLEFVGERVQTVRPSFGSLVAIPVTLPWGPLGSDAGSAGGGPTLVEDFATFESIYGSSDSPGRDAVLGAFNGMGVDVGGGAGGVYVYRAATNAAAAATVNVPNTTPATAITLTAKYKGTDGNLIRYVTEDDPITVGSDRMRILFRGATVESYTFAQTDIQSLADQINATSKYVRQTGPVVTGTALTASAAGGVALAGGNDGSSLDANAWQAALDALTYKDFGIFAPFNLTDTTIKALIFQWMRTMAQNMRPVRVVDGGASGESVAAAITDAALLRDPHRIRFGVGTYHDDLLNKDVSTAQLAPRLAGVLAARGLRSGLTRAELGGLSIVSGVGVDQIATARDGGVTALRQISSDVAELAVAQGVTTFIDRTVAAMPFELWSEPRIIGLFDYIVRRMTRYGDDAIVGDLTVSQDTRDAVSKELSKLLDELVAQQLAIAGTTSFDVLNTDDDPTLSDAIPYWFRFRPTRTANYLLGQAKVS
jgi:hypothetical protein